MTAVSERTAAPGAELGAPRDRRGSWLPAWPMVTKRVVELTRRRGLMVVLAVVTVGLPSLFLLIRILLHAFDAKSYGPAGGYDVFTGLVAGVLYVFGFIVAATLGCTAGAADLQEGVFRHLVVTGRSRVASYLARIPAGLAIILTLVAVGYSVVCVVCTLAAPTALNFDGANVPAGLSKPAFEAWASDHYGQTLCNFPLELQGPKSGGGIPIPCGPNGTFQMSSLPPGTRIPTAAQLQAVAVIAARQSYDAYRNTFRSPPINLMVRAGLWLELEAAVGLIVGLGLGSLIGQRTVAVILMIVLEVILTPLLLRAHLPHLIDLQRSIVGVATDHLRPNGMPIALGGGGPQDQASVVTETHAEVALVVVAWLVAWTGLGAWRMATRDA